VELLQDGQTYWDSQTAHEAFGDTVDPNGQFSSFLPDTCITCAAKLIALTEAEEAKQ